MIRKKRVFFARPSAWMNGTHKEEAVESRYDSC